MKAARICVITAGHLTTCPRMLKAADALVEHGYQVRIVSTRFLDWAAEGDQHLAAQRSKKWPSKTWQWEEVDYSSGWTKVWSSVRSRAAATASRVLGTHTPFPIQLRAHARVHPELTRKAAAEPADLYYGGTTGGLAATAEAAAKNQRPYALDLEDFHSGEREASPDGTQANQIAEAIGRRVLPEARFLTTASAPMANAYEESFGVKPISIHNTFPLPSQPPPMEPADERGLSLYWFSQTIGPKRGLETVIRAAGKAEITAQLHLRGRPTQGYLEELTALARSEAPTLKLVHHDPASADRMVELAQPYHVGLAAEPGFSPNNRLALSNKALVYILAGLAVAMSDTPGHRSLATDLGPGALVYASDEVEPLAAGLARWAKDPQALATARHAAWQAARQRWHWEHHLERGALLQAVEQALASPAGRAR